MTRLTVTTSWDDGHPLDFRIAELLEKHGLRGTFYVPRRAEQEVMTEAQLRELSRYFEVGAHTLDHVYLNTIPMSDAADQIAGSKKWIETVTGTSCRIFCFPGGARSAAHFDLLREAGFWAVRNVELMNLDGPRRRSGLWEIPTTVQAFPHKRTTYLKNAARRRVLPRPSAALAVLRSRDWAVLANALLENAGHTQGVFHLWGHSWEIEEHGLWGELEGLFAAMSELTNSVHRRTNLELCSVYES